LSVAAGAFGAHGLTARLKNDSSLSRDEANHRLEIFQKGAQYQMYHALAITVVGLVSLRSSSACLTAAGWSFLAGIVLFCGFLYALGLGAPKTFARPVPLGGGAFIAGWICLAVAAWKIRP
jgi:uncharacterized membrane protein YgdD (TMEM256/DUF423 family)